jgi:SAM-dependent methyltransferase
MNAFERWCCGSALWRYLTRRAVLPWILPGSVLGEHVLELGAGAGPATSELARRAPRVTSLEYDRSSALKLRARTNPANVSVIQGDAAGLPFANDTFSSAIAILMLHHLKSAELQDRAFSEIHRGFGLAAFFWPSIFRTAGFTESPISGAPLCPWTRRQQPRGWWPRD